MDPFLWWYLCTLSEGGSPGLHPRSSLIPLFMSLSLVIHPSIHPLSYLASFEWSLFLLKLVRSIPFFLWSKNPYWYTGETCKVGELQSREFGERLAKSWLFITSCNASLMPLSIASAFRCWQQGGWGSHWCSAQSREICLYWPTSMARSYQITAYTVICQHSINSTVGCECSRVLEAQVLGLISGSLEHYCSLVQVQ